MLEELNNRQTQTAPRTRGNGYGGYGNGYGGYGNGYGGIGTGTGDGNGESIPYTLDAVDLLTRLAAQHVVKPTGETR